MELLPLNNERIAIGQERFLHKHPKVRAKIDALSKEEANILGIDISEFRSVETMREIRLEAARKGVDSTEFFWSFVADSEEELKAMIAANNEKVKRILGI